MANNWLKKYTETSDKKTDKPSANSWLQKYASPATTASPSGSNSTARNTGSNGVFTQRKPDTTSSAPTTTRDYGDMLSDVARRAQNRLQMYGSSEDIAAEIQRLNSEISRLSDPGTYKDSDAPTLAELRERRDVLSTLWPAAERSEKAMAEYEVWNASATRAQGYTAMMDEPDFAELSQYKSTGHGVPQYNPALNTYTDTGFDDITYDYINRNETARSVAQLNELSIGAYAAGVDSSRLQRMTDDEISIYNYLYAKRGKEAADEYIAFITTDANYAGLNLNTRQRQYEADAWAESAEKDPVAASVYSVITSPARGLSFVGQVGDMIEDGKIDQNAGYNRYTNDSAAIRNTVSGIVEKNWGGAGSFLYNTGMSMGDFLMSAAAGGGTKLSSAILSTGAAAQQTVDAKDRGLSDTQAFTLGTISGLAEYVTEKASLDALLDAAGLGKRALTYWLKNVVTEASEEGASSIINTFADVLVSGDRSEWSQAVREYRSSGYSENEAFWRAMGDKAAEIGLDMLGGAISGGVVSGAVVGGNAISSARETAQQRQQQASGDAANVEVEPIADDAADEQIQRNAALLRSVMEEAGEVAATDAQERAETPQRVVLPATAETAENAAKTLPRSYANEPSEAGNTRSARPIRGQTARTAEEASAVARNAGYGEYGTRALVAVAESAPGAPIEEVRARFEAAYEAGRVEVPRERVQLTNSIQQIAYDAGRRDAIMSMSKRTEINTNLETEVEPYGNEVYLRDGGERTGSAYTGGQIPAVESGAGRYQSGQAQSRPADAEAALLTYGERVSTASLGIGGGTTDAAVRLVTDGNTTATAAARRLARERGLRVILFAGDNLSIRQSDGSVASVRGYISGDRVFVRADHPRYTADQIMRHEAGHDMIAKGEVDPNDVRERIAQIISEERLDELSAMYAEAYAGSGLSAEDIWEEVICDSLGDMNIFSGTLQESAAAEFIDETKSATNAESETARTRAPPAEGRKNAAPEGGEKYSFEGYDSKTGRGIYRSNFPSGTPKAAKAARILHYIQNVWSKKPISLIIRNADGTTRHIQARFDPSYDPSGNTPSDATKLMAGNRHGNASDRRVTLDLADDYYQIASEAVYNYSKAEEGKTSPTHSGVKEWHYFVNDIMFREYGETKNTPYRVTVNVKERSDGSFVYSFSAERQNERPSTRRTLHADVNQSDNVGEANAQPSTEIIPEDGAEVKGKFSREPSSTNSDAAYIAAVERGDMETAQRMVDEAAGRSGYTIKAYHGTLAESFTEFKKEYVGTRFSYDEQGFFFTNRESIAEDYARSEFDMNARGRVIAAYLKTENPLVVDAKFLRKEGLGNLYRSNDAINVWDAYQPYFIEEAEARNADSIILDDGSSKMIVVFEPEQIKSSDPITYDNNGDVIPLSRRFDDTGSDIRYSRELDSIETLREQNEALQEKVEYWRRQTQRTTRETITLRPGDIDKLARRLIKSYSSELRAADISGELRGLGEYIVRGEGEQAELAWTDVKDRAVRIAHRVVNAAQVLTNGEVEADYREIMSYLRRTPLAFSDKADIPDFDDYRKRNFGRITISESGTPVDMAWKELQERFGPSYFPESITHPADQLLHIAELLDGMKPILDNPFSYNMAEAIEYVANDIIDSLISDAVRQSPPTFADRQAAKLDAQKRRDHEIAERLRERKNARIEEIRKQGIERTKAALDRVRADRDRKIADLKHNYRTQAAKARESRVAAALRAKIQRHVKELSEKLLRPTDKRHIPEALRGPVARLLEAINRESAYELEYGTDAKYHRVKPGESRFTEPTKRTKAFVELRRAYGEVAGELVIDPDLLTSDDVPGLLDEVIGMADTPIVEMNSEQLETIWRTIRAVEASIRSANKMFAAARFKTVSEAAEALRSDNKGKHAPAEYRSVFDKAQQLTGLDMMTPETFLHRLGASGDAIFRMMRNAQDKHIRIMKAVADFTRRAVGKTDVRKLERELHTVTLGGEEVTLSTAQLMEMYVLKRREQAQAHILEGGILPERVNGRGIKKISRAEPVRGVTVEEIDAALGLLSPEQVRLAEQLQEYASTTLSDYGNEASMEVYDYKKFGEKNYWPIRSNKQETKSDVQKDTQVTSVANRGFTKQTKPNANTSVLLGSIFDTFATHASEMATYAAWLGATEDINRIRNYTFRDGDGARTGTVKGIIDRVHGSRGSAYLQKLLSDIANGIKGTHGETEYMSGLVGNYKAASVGANLRVIIQQPTAMLRALDMIAPRYLVSGMKPNSGWKKALKYAPIAQWKDWGYFDINTGRQMKDVLFDTDGALGKVKQASMWGAGKMDSLTWGQLWNAVEAETKATNKSLKPGTEEFYEAVAQRFTEIVDHTQVVDGILQRSQIMRSASGLTKMATSFMGEPTKQYNMMLSAIYDVRSKDGRARSQAKKHLARTVFSLLVSGVANAAVQSIIDALRDDDKEKDYWERWLAAFTGFTGEEEGFGDKFAAFWSGNIENIINPTQYIPYAKDIVSLIQGYDVTRMDMESVSKVITAAQNMLASLFGASKYNPAGASANLFAEAARLLGLPVANVRRDVRAMAMTAAVESDNYLLQYRIEKATLNINYSGNSGTFMDILYNAYMNDTEAYEIIYADMVKNGVDPKRIKDSIETRLKEAQGVKSVSDLESRYLTPEQQTRYDGTMRSVAGSAIWEDASAAQREAALDMLYDLVVGNHAGEELREKIDGGAKYGIDDTDYILFRLALEMADEPTENGKYGTYTGEEVEAAIKMLELGQDASGYLWTTAGKSEKSNPWG